MTMPFDVLGDGAFREVGVPRAVAATENLVAVAGSLGTPQWVGGSLQRVVGGRGWHRVGIYERSTVRCSMLLALRSPVNAVAFDPTERFLAVGVGSYDGGWRFLGELVLIDVVRGVTVSVLREDREVLDVAWTTDRALDILVSPADDEQPPEPVRYLIPVDLWADVDHRSVSLDELDGVISDPPWDDGADLGETLTQIAGAAGQPYEPRRQVWDVHVDESGDVLSCLEGVRLESWAPIGERRFSVPAPGRGCQLDVLTKDQVLTVVEPPWGPWESGYARQPGSVEIIDRRSGDRVRGIDVPFPAAAAVANDGPFLIRNSDLGTTNEGESVVAERANPRTETISVGGFDLFNHSFRIRRAPEILLLTGDGKKPSRDKWITRLRPKSHRFGRSSRLSVERMYPLEWRTDRGAHLMGGPGCYLGHSLVHAGWIHSGRGLIKGNSFLVRRSYESGELQWEYRASAQFSGIDVVGADVWATLMSGELVRLDAETGEVRDETVLEIEGHSVIPLSLSAATGWLAIGLLDGRVIRMKL